MASSRSGERGQAPRNEAVAPYNFVPLPREAMAHPEQAEIEGGLEGRYHPGRLHGWIELEITTETPLYTRAAVPLKDREPEVAAARFFHHGNPEEPVIPGSSLRGMLRMLVEVVTWGKVTAVEQGPLSFRDVGGTTVLGHDYRDVLLGAARTPDGTKGFEFPAPGIRAGYLHQKGQEWFIRPATVYEGESFVWVEAGTIRSDLRLDPGDLGSADQRPGTRPVWVKPAARRWLRLSPRDQRDRAVSLHLAISTYVSAREEEGLVSGTLVVPGPMKNKHRYAVVYAEDRDKEFPVPYERLSLYKADGGHPAEGGVVFYRLDGKSGSVADLGWTVMMRLKARHKLEDVIPGGLRTPEPPDVAEGLFGSVIRRADGTTIARRGRIRVEDACLQADGSGDAFVPGHEEGLLSPRILAAPKPSAFALYLEQPPDAFKDQKKRHTYESADPVARGHKFYWHKRWVQAHDIFESRLYRPGTASGDTQHTMVQPVKAQVTFRSRLRFENLSPLELGALWFVLDLPKALRHRLGMGKPLGMGTVRIRPRLHLEDRAQRYSRLLREAGRLETGELGGEEVDRRLRQALAAFRGRITQHVQATGEVKGPVPDLWDIPRLKALRQLLEWEPGKEAGDTAYVMVDKNSFAKTEGSQNYRWSPDNHQWKERWVLPPPVGAPRPLPPDPPEAEREAGPPASPRLRDGQRLDATVLRVDGKGTWFELPGGVRAVFRQRFPDFRGRIGQTVKVEVTNSAAKPLEVRPRS